MSKPKGSSTLTIIAPSRAGPSTPRYLPFSDLNIQRPSWRFSLHYGWDRGSASDHSIKGARTYALIIAPVELPTADGEAIGAGDVEARASLDVHDLVCGVLLEFTLEMAVNVAWRPGGMRRTMTRV
jgi:hypothetical protein